MPPGRRSKAPAPRSQQTLAFSNKVTKPTHQTPSTKSNQKLSKISSEALATAVSTPSPGPEEQAKKEEEEGKADIKISPPQHQEQQPSEIPEQTTQHQQGAISSADTPRKTAIRSQPSSTIPVSEVEAKAKKVSDKRIREYWQAKEEERMTARVHQQGLSVQEKVLREFDMSSQFGPCIGIPRMKRWKRADNLGLKPPIEVLAVLLKEEARGNGKAERAFMDGLLSSKLAVNE